MKAIEILNASVDLISQRGKERDKENGERSMKRCVESFNAMTGAHLTETDGWKFMMLLKMARSESGHFKLDDYLDMTAYAALAGECESESKLVKVSGYPGRVDLSTIDLG